MTRKKRVADDVLGKFIRFWLDVLERVRKGSLDPQRIVEAVQKVVTETSRTTIRIAEHIIDCDAAPFVPKGWTVEQHIPGGQLEWDPAKMALYLDKDQQNGKTINGHELRKKLTRKGFEGTPVFNANLLDYLLANPTLIPKEWKGKAVFFWGTIYRDSDGNLHVRCLDDWGGEWGWQYIRLDGRFGDTCYAAVLVAYCAVNSVRHVTRK